MRREKAKIPHAHSPVFAIFDPAPRCWESSSLALDMSMCPSHRTVTAWGMFRRRITHGSWLRAAYFQWGACYLAEHIAQYQRNIDARWTRLA